MGNPIWNRRRDRVPSRSARGHCPGACTSTTSGGQGGWDLARQVGIEDLDQERRFSFDDPELHEVSQVLFLVPDSLTLLCEGTAPDSVRVQNGDNLQYLCLDPRSLRRRWLENQWPPPTIRAARRRRVRPLRTSFADGARGQFLNPSRLLDTPYVQVSCMIIDKADEVHRLACLELRGGNHSAAYAAELPGLAGWVSCRPLRPSPRGGDLYYLSACSQGVIARDYVVLG